MKMSTFKNVFIFLLAIFCLLPWAIMLIKSLQGPAGDFDLQQYGRALLQTERFFRGFWNSVIYTVVIIAINIPVSLLAAYGFTQFSFRGRDGVFWAYIVLMLMPFQATIVPQYLTLRALNILDTPQAVILPNAFSTFGTFLIAQYMRGIDKEIFDAARIDGHNELSLMLKIAMPLCRPILFALTTLLFINYWSMVEQPLIFLTNQQLLPLSVLLSGTGIFKKIAFACGIIFTILPLLLYFLSYEDLIQGIALSSTGNDRGEIIRENGKREEVSYKRRIGRTIIAFFIIMLTLTLVTQKITYAMTAEVEVVSLRRGELLENPQIKNSESLGYFSSIVPASSIVSEGLENYIFIALEEKSGAKKLQAVQVNVSISAKNKNECAVSGGLPSNASVIKYTSKPLMEGSYIRVLNWGDDNE